MIVHLSVLVLILLVSGQCGAKETYYRLNYPGYVMPKAPWVIVFGYLAILAALRSGMNDTSVYIHSFEQTRGTWEECVRIWTSDGKDKGFGSLANLFKLFVSDNYHMWFLLFAAIESWCFVHVYRRESYSFLITCYYFFASTLYYNYFSMMRQWFAVALLFAGFGWMQQKKWVPYFALCIIAAQFHTSAYLGIPFYFIVQGKPWGTKQNLILIGSAFALMMLSPLLEALSVAMEGTTYDYVLETMQTNSGSSPIRILIAAVPVVLAYQYREQIAGQNDRALDLAVNFAVLNFLLNTLAAFTSGLYVIRLSVYVSPYCGIVYSYILSRCIPVKSRQTVKILFYIVYFAFFWYQMDRGGSWGYNSDILGKFGYSGLFSYTPY